MIKNHENTIIPVKKKIFGEHHREKQMSAEKNQRANWKPSIFCLGTGMTRSRSLERVGWHFQTWLH